MPSENKNGVAGTDLQIGDKVRLISGGPEMTVIGCSDGDIKCAFFQFDGDPTSPVWGDMGIVALPRAALADE